MTDTANASASAKAEKVITTVTMDDGTIVEFAGKKRLIKTAVSEGANVKFRLDFINGEVRFCSLPEGLLMAAAEHGLGQKLGDEVAGITDPDDMVLAVTELIDRLQAGDWNAPRSEGVAGTSMLARAIAEARGKDIKTVQEFLKTKSNAEKAAMRLNPAIKPILDRMELEKATKAGKNVDSEALLEGL